ncbi:O-antigen ligase family protein [Labrys miyagiensis]|nr:O-antigen ligase family protein [Labrys miyagiensis]
MRTLRNPAKQQPSSPVTADRSLFYRFFSALLFLTLYMIVVKINYEAGAPNDDALFDAKRLLVSDQGDNITQIIHLTIFVSVFLGVLLSDWRAMFLSISIPYLLACAWCILSFLWAIDPGASVRRSIFTCILLFSTANIVRLIGTRRTIEVLYVFLGLAMVVSLIAVCLSFIPLFSFAVHPGNEADPSVVGAWRGVFWHKNTAGPIATVALMVFMHVGLDKGRRLDWFLFFCSAIFLIGTKSKSAIALAVLVLLIGYGYRSLASKSGGGKAFGWLTLYVLANLVILALCEHDTIHAFLTDPANVSGRVAIWLSMWTYIKSHLWLGSGFGSFYGIGYNSPIFTVATEKFVLGVIQSHNGYIEVLASTGLIGFALAIFALVIWPACRFFMVRPRDARLYALCFSIWFYGLLANFTESQFFSLDKQIWLLVVIAISMVHNKATMRAEPGAAPIPAPPPAELTLVPALAPPSRGRFPRRTRQLAGLRGSIPSQGPLS